MDNLNELGLKFGEGTVWLQKTKCGWCKKTKLCHTYDQYLLKGNICNKCSTIINDKHIESIRQERIQRLEEKKLEMERLGNKLDQEITEEERQEIVDKMMRLHTEIKYTAIDLDYGM